MTIRPIIFGGPMVRALLAGTKTQTRRITPCPLSKTEVGDLLYVREAFAYCGRNAYPESDCMKHPSGGDSVIHRSGWDRSPPASGWRPSIHMPRWASRLTLRVNRVFFDPIQRISNEDAYAEGRPECQMCGGCGWVNSGPDGGYECSEPMCGESDRDWFHALWDTLYTKPGETWADNPMVVAIQFEVIRANVDALKEMGDD